MIKYIIIISFLFYFGFNTFCIEISDGLLNAIAKVESNCNDNIVGDNGKAFGRYQIHKIYVADVNRVCFTKYTHKDCFDSYKAKKIVTLYLTHYGRLYEYNTGKKATNEVLARIHNGGCFGYKKQSTIKYWNKVKKYLIDSELPTT